MTLPPGILKQLQEYMAAKITERGFADETLQERMILLTEEVGELAKTVRKSSGMNLEKNKENNQNAGEEITDVLNMLFAVAIKFGLDIEEEFKKKEAKNDQRTYKKS
jgi:NTP pyrophosphatase (non-canonical NTP hydrolase)